MEFEIAGKVQHPKPCQELLTPAGALHSAREHRQEHGTVAVWL
jgi:hypothetical protein